ncbi:FGGY-family carbohydrate kinase [Thioclava sp. 15-R06ZXC-3]|uniref:FGGY-family carbohydrate kinase n=1 Tax=Thioclava arctica TaxID=3238301 RepID=A0ABV3TJY1_9RHOB
MDVGGERGEAILAGKLFIGIDVGTGSARAGVFDDRGELLAVGKHPLDIWSDDFGQVEQSSAQIWQAVCAAVREALTTGQIDARNVAGMGFDATCSLVVIGAQGGLAVSDSTHPERDVIVWMDHRARDQAKRINEGRHDVLRYVGGRISPEMQTPKLLWLKEERPDTYAAATQFFDLTDFLTWKATGALERSSCTVTCKWTYLAHENRWDEGYFHAIGLGDLAEDGFARIGTRIVEPGTALGTGLSDDAAQALGLCAGTPVAAGLIDAHAGGVGTVSASGGIDDPAQCLGYVFGTSSCTMTSTREPVFVPGVWGPYYSAMIPGMWLNEGGQSAAGAAIAHLVQMHPAAAEADALAKDARVSVPQFLADRALALAGSASDAVRLAQSLHVVPEFLGNRAPLADPDARAVIVGQGMETGLDSLVMLYIAGVCGLGYGLRQIIETQAKYGAPITEISISGGAGSHPLTRQIIADATGVDTVITQCDEPVLLGAAILGALAGGRFGEMTEAMRSMSHVDDRFAPAIGAVARIHEARFNAFLTLQGTAKSLRQSMAEASA